jgi:hypothetical protein
MVHGACGVVEGGADRSQPVECGHYHERSDMITHGGLECRGATLMVAILCSTIQAARRVPQKNQSSL